MAVASPRRRVLIRSVRFLLVRPAAVLGLLAVFVLALAAVLLAPRLLTTFHLGGPGAMTEPAATAAYLHGNQNYDAGTMWASLSEDARQRFAASGGTQQDLAQQMQSAKDRGIMLQNVSYVGGKDLPDGTSIQFYVVGVKSGSSGSVNYVPYMFTLDHQGKILKVE